MNNKIKIFGFFSFILCLITIGLFVQSCNNDEDYSSFTTSQKQILKEKAIVGEEHNLYMEQIYKQLKAQNKIKK